MKVRGSIINFLRVQESIDTKLNIKKLALYKIGTK